MGTVASEPSYDSSVDYLVSLDDFRKQQCPLKPVGTYFWVRNERKIQISFSSFVFFVFFYEDQSSPGMHRRTLGRNRLAFQLHDWISLPSFRSNDSDQFISMAFKKNTPDIYGVISTKTGLLKIPI